MVFHCSRSGFMIFQGSRSVFYGSRWVFMVIQGSRVIFQGSRSVFMVFHGSRSIFLVFSMLQDGFSKFFMIPG